MPSEEHHPTSSGGALTVVVANAAESSRSVLPTLDALHDQLDSARGDRVVWATRTGLVPTHPLALTVVSGSASDGRGELYGHGLRGATTELIAFTDSTTVVETGWRAAVDQAWCRNEPFVGGPVHPGARRTSADWAGFLVEYGPHAVAPYVTNTGAVSANNMVFSTHVLDPFRGRPLWKTVVLRDLASRGIQPSVIPELAVTALKRYELGSLLGERFAQGWLYGTHARVECGRIQRGLRTLAAGPLPVVLFARLARTVRRSSVLRRPLAVGAPLVLFALVAWSAGEARGYLIGGASPAKVF